MDHLSQDVRLAFRQLLKQRSFSAIVVVTLGLAVGVNALMFSFVNFFVLRPLPFGDVSRTTMIFAKHPERGGDRMGASYADFVEWRRDNTTFEDLGALDAPHPQPDRQRRPAARPGVRLPPRASSRSGTSAPCTAGSSSPRTTSRVRPRWPC